MIIELSKSSAAEAVGTAIAVRLRFDVHIFQFNSHRRTERLFLPFSIQIYYLNSMKIVAEETYHIYNQGNNRETIFFSHKNYLEFLIMFRKFVFPFCKVLSYCLMPNHYHFLIYATEDSEKRKQSGNIETCELSNGFRLLQSTYAKYINKQRNRTGSLFKQKAHAKAMHDGDRHYDFAAFQYIHQNPIKANLVLNIEKWLYSSYVDYAGLRNGTLCDKDLAFKLIGFDKENFVAETYKDIDEKQVSNLFYRMEC